MSTPYTPQRRPEDPADKNAEQRPVPTRRRASVSDEMASHAHRRHSGSHARDERKERRERKPPAIVRIVNQWFDRLVAGIFGDDVSARTEQYASHRTTRDYIWNTAGQAAWGAHFPLLTIVATQLVGTETAGMLSMAYVTASMLLFIANYGARTYQVSDIDEDHSFADYQVQRVLSCVIMLAVGFGWARVHGYTGQMATICTGAYLFRAVDGFADVYEGRLQQVDKLYLGGISQMIRSALSFVLFAVVLFVTHDAGIACMAMAVGAIAATVLFTIPVTFFESPRSRGLSPIEVGRIFKQCFPLFLALFLYSLIDNMPKFAMEGVLSYDNQLFYNAMYFPSHMIIMVTGIIYKPQLVRMANIWADPEHRGRFNLLVIAMIAITMLVGGLTFAYQASIGIPLTSWLYGYDFEQFRTLAYIMIAGGTLSAVVEFMTQTISVLREQGVITKVYLIGFGFSVLVSMLMVGITGLEGAVVAYLDTMGIVMVLLGMEYIDLWRRLRSKV